MSTRLPAVMWKYASGADAKYPFFQTHHETFAGSKAMNDLRRFLYATMDEPRWRHGEDFAEAALSAADMVDGLNFRKGVLRSELGGFVSYDKQRDHAAHTVHNYLLGWYLLERSRILQDSFHDQFRARALPHEMGNGVGSLKHSFSGVWPVVSLMHDVGYLFQGDLNQLNQVVQSEHLRTGALLAGQYFSSWLWQDVALDSVEDQERLFRLAKDSAVPRVSSDSMTAVIDSLRNLGPLRQLLRAVSSELRAGGVVHSANHVYELSSHQGNFDAFDIWESNYSCYGQLGMAARIRQLREGFLAIATRGLINPPLRMLDHGIAGGLLLLLCHTYFYRLYFGLPALPPSNDAKDEKVWFKVRNTIASVVYDVDWWWWSAAIWATASVAMHNILSMPRGDLPPCCNLSPLKLEEDALAYLGVLVDILQEYDRAAVRRVSALGGNLPLQGSDVRVRFDSTTKPVTIHYGSDKEVEHVTESLGAALIDWGRIVKVS